LSAEPPGQILTFSERPEVAAEMLAAARRLSEASGLQVTSLVYGRDSRARAEDEIARGADRVVLAGSQAPSTTDSEVLLEVAHQVVNALQPAIVLIGSTLVGAEIAARLGQRLGVATASECLELELDDAGDLMIERFVYGGRFIARRVLRSSPKIAAVQVKRFEPLAPDAQRRGDTRELPVALAAPVVAVVARKEPERSQVDIGKAEVIVSAGRGLKSKDDLALLQALARALGGELGGSRPLVEMQWIPRARQVGLSGEKVKPRLYVACGVSGQIEHIAGMRPSRVVVAINTDADAPIHREADYSITQDLYDVIPALLAVLEERRSGTAGGPSSDEAKQGSALERA
jgi:electron transfer flavoprotein alpha subunit